MPYKEFEVKKLYYSIGEVAEMLSETTSLVRFWSEKFPEFIKPERNKKGNRKYTDGDVKNLKTIHHLVKKLGMTLEGAAIRMKDNKEGVDNRAEVVDRLGVVKKKLLEISKSLSEGDSK